jgi:hypothetical protein
VKGALDTGNGQYDLEGTISGCIDFPDPIGKACASIDGVLSSKGIGACGSILGLGAYFRYEWSGDLSIDFGCDLGPIQVDAQSAVAGGARTVTIPAGVPITSIVVKSRKGSPRISLQGPGGVKVRNPKPGLPVRRKGLVIMPLSGLHETVIGIRKPAAGTWTITASRGSPAITGIEHANGLPPARISATVTGKGRQRILAYKLRARPGQQVTFAERAPGVFHVIGSATGATGTIPFTPADSPVTARTIVALVQLSGLPRENLTVGHYDAPPTLRPGKPSKVHVKRGAGRLEISWGAAPGAGSYLVAVTLGDGRRLLLTPRKGARSLVVPQVRRGVGAQVEVTAVAADGVPGAAASGGAAAEGMPAAVAGIEVVTAGSKRLIHWRATPGATAYLVRLEAGGARETLVAWKPSLPPSSALRALRHGHRLRIVVRAISADGQIGPPQAFTYDP